MHPLVWLFRDRKVVVSSALLSKGATTRLPRIPLSLRATLENRLGFRLGLNLHDPIRGHWSSPSSKANFLEPSSAASKRIPRCITRYTHSEIDFSRIRNLLYSNFRRTSVYIRVDERNSTLGLSIENPCRSKSVHLHRKFDGWLRRSPSSGRRGGDFDSKRVVAAVARKKEKKKQSRVWVKVIADSGLH